MTTPKSKPPPDPVQALLDRFNFGHVRKAMKVTGRRWAKPGPRGTEFCLPDETQLRRAAEALLIALQLLPEPAGVRHCSGFLAWREGGTLYLAFAVEHDVAELSA